MRELRLTATVLILAGLVSVSSAQYNHTIYVDPERGSNSTACLDSSSPSQPCRNLSYAFQFRASSTQYVLQPGTHYLNSTASDVPFTDLQDIAITGNGSARVVCSTTNTGLAFISVENISFGNVTFSKCAALRNSTSKNVSTSPGEFKLLFTNVALYFSQCANVAMDHVHVVDSPGASGVTLYNTIGVNSFHECSFTNNSNTNKPLYPGGGGVYIEFSYCLPGNTSCRYGAEESYTDHNAHSTYDFTNCEFSFNEASTVETGSVALFLVPYRQNHVAFGRGGGLSMFFNGNANNNSVQITDCMFSENRAEWGAGVFVEFHDTSGANTVNISGSQCNFTRNICTGTAGGGMRVGHYVYDEVEGMNGNAISISSCQFLQNEANNGGGLSVSPTRQQAPRNQLFTLSMSTLTFELNRATYGAAMKIDLFSLIVEGLKPKITITDCYFRNNTVYPKSYSGPREVGIGVVYITEVDVMFRGATTWFENNGSALAVVAATIDFTNSTTSFDSNEGVNGGAIAMLGSAKLLIDNSTGLYFFYNAARVYGGAIYNKYTDRNNYEAITNCFIVHMNASLDPDDWNAKFHFYDNRDSRGENAIYSTSILPCGIAGGNGEQNVTKILCWKNWTYDGQTNNCQQFIRTGPGYIFPKSSRIVFSSSTENATNDTIIQAFPGELIQLPILAFDDLKHSIPVVYTATSGVNDTSNHTNSKAIIDPNYAYVSNNNIRVYGVHGSNITVDLNSIGDRDWHVRVIVNLIECPPGLTPTTINCSSSQEAGATDVCSSHTCECLVKNTYTDNVQCNSLSHASLASGYWMGLLKEDCDSERCYVVADCPYGFCKTSRAEFIPLPHSDLSEHLCGPQNRTGKVCGKCIEHYGPALNSDTYMCVQCNISRHQLAAHATYYVLAVYVPLFLLFLAIIVFNIKLTAGPANAFILYSQVISSTFGLDAGGRIPLGSVIPNFNRYIMAYKFPHGIFNLKFFEQFIPPKHLCLGTSLNVLDIFRLNYIVAFFPLVMILVIVALYKITDCCSRCRLSRIRRRQSSTPKNPANESSRIGNALIPAFASFILLSYTKFSLTSSYSASYVTLRDARGYQVGPVHAYYAGQHSFTDPDYIFGYLLPAIIIFIVFVAIPPLVLLDYPMRLFEKALRKVPWLWRRYPQIKIHIVLDAFQGCYKNKWRCFAGLYFVFRLLINVTNALAVYLQQFVLQEVYCVVFALLVAFLKPYKKEYHLFNYTDSFIFLNLAVINLITLYLYTDTRRGSDPSVFVFSIQYILVFLPLIYMVSYIVWSVLPIPNTRARVKEWLANRQSYQQLDNLIRNSGTATPEPTDDVDWERAEDINRYSPTTPAALRNTFPPHSTEENEKTGTGENIDSGMNSRVSVGGRGSRRSYGSMGDSSTVSFDTAIPGEDD